MEARSLASSLMILLVCMIGDASNPEGETLSTTSSLLIASVTILVTIWFLVTSCRMIMFGLLLQGNGKDSRQRKCARELLGCLCCTRMTRDEWARKRGVFVTANASQRQVDDVFSDAGQNNDHLAHPGPIVGIEMMDIRGVQWTENQELHENPLRKQI